MKVITEEIEVDDSEPTDESLLARIRGSAARLLEVEREISDAKASLKPLEDEQKTLSRETLPQLMTEAGIPSIEVGNALVARDKRVEAGLPKEDLDKRREALNWMVDHGEGGIINRTLTVSLPKGDAILAEKLVAAINAVDPKLCPMIDETVHAMSYKGMANRLVKEGADYPAETLQIFIIEVAKVVAKR